MLNFEEFIERAKEEVRCSIPEKLKGAEVVIGEIKKIGSRYTSIGVKGNEQYASYPVANLSKMYENYLGGVSIETLFEDMKYIVFMPVKSTDVAKCMSSYAFMKERLFVRLSNAVFNEQLLNEVPHKKIHDLAMTYHVCISSNPNSLMSTIVNYRMLETMGIEEDKLHEDALRNSRHILMPVVKPISEMIGLPSDSSMQVVTDTINVNGAAAIMYPEVREKLTRQFGGDFFIIPSSIHEVLALPYDPERTEEFNSIVKMINENQVMPKDRLSDHVYIYDSRNDRIRNPEAFLN